MEYWKRNVHMMLTAIVILSFVSATDPPSGDLLTCAVNCTCPDAMTANCKGVSQVPNFSDRSIIRILNIESHHITQLNTDDFKNFTHLEQLYIMKGVLKKMAPGAFDLVKNTIVMIDVSRNAISDIDSNVFVNLTKINKIVLNANHLTKLKSESFVNLPNLVTLNIISNYVETLDKNAFMDLPILEILNLFDNNLKEIPFESLASLEGLKVITLTRNKIKAIPEETDVFIPTLEDIYLDSNPITELKVFPNISNSLQRIDMQFTNVSTVTKDTWKYQSKLDLLNIGGTLFPVITAGMFEGLTSLKKLLLRDMILLTSVGPDAFRGIQKATTIDLADCKKLKTIDETAFMSTDVTSFFLKDSGITFIPENLLKWSQMHTVSLGGNPINCDCKVAWMLNSSIFGNNTGVKDSFDHLICASPKEHYGKRVTSLHPINLSCKPIPDDHGSRFTTGIIIALICFVFMTTFALLMKYRKQITISCRRYYQYRRYKNDMVFTVEHDTSIAELEDTDMSDGRPLKDMRLETVPLET